MPPPTAPDGRADEIRDRVLRLIGGRRMPPAEILQDLGARFNLRKNRVRQAIRELVAAGELAYTFEHGRTFLEPSFDRLVRVGDRIVLLPPGKAAATGPADVIIRIAPGAAFGAGRHPTTRLALRGIEAAMTGGRPCAGGPASRMLDIGTGSGVLAIAAVLMGVGSGIGIDVDPCAVAEARANARLNGLEARVTVSEAPIERFPGPFALITANLRLPTLVRLSASIACRTLPGAAVVLSGIRVEEMQQLLPAYAGRSFLERWRGEEGGWSGVLLVRVS